ncbi:hypothetical protein E8K88_11940 [Lampropedia aestuarii]|uniref:Uncharacterized protein n=1 Tax=Lampropedia aestuarii TaxID=2562762 RepID=A0A4S5BIY8_9BURK|nr:hypothetical protein [Lampropedia aestuarii]THJ32404.1 hypothetical protein E8K88_11940 [Lampropedia aestuarii]
MGFQTPNDWITGRKPVPTQSDTNISAPRFVQILAAADSAANNVGVIGILPAGTTPALPLLVDASALGGTAAISIGILNADGNDISTAAVDGGAAWATAVAVADAGAAQIEPTQALLAVKAAGYDRKIAVKFTAPGAAAGELGLTVAYRSPN